MIALQPLSQSAGPGRLPDIGIDEVFPASSRDVPHRSPLGSLTGPPPHPRAARTELRGRPRTDSQGSAPAAVTVTAQPAHGTASGGGGVMFP